MATYHGNIADVLYHIQTLSRSLFQARQGTSKSVYSTIIHLYLVGQLQLTALPSIKSNSRAFQKQWPIKQGQEQERDG